MVNVNFYCRKSKVNRKGLSPIEMSIIINGQRLIMSVGMNYSPSAFVKDSKKGELLAYLQSCEHRVYDLAMQMSVTGKVSLSELKKAYARGSLVEVYTLKQMIDDFFAHINRRVRDSTYDGYLWTEKIIYAVLSPNLDVNSMSVDDIEKFQDEQVRRGYSASYRNHNLGRFKTMFQYAVDCGKVNVKNIFRMAKRAKYVDVIHIMSDSEYDKLVNGKCRTQILENVRLYFVLACNCGLAYVDMMNLNKSQIVEINGYTVICGRRVKTNSSFSAVVLPDGRKVLDEYGDVKSFCNYTNQHLNILAKKVGKELGISVPLHSHLCRHQYITMLIRKGVPLSMVKRCVGHSDIAMTERYLSLTVDDVVEAVSSVL